jgi:hypothetical protein
MNECLLLSNCCMCLIHKIYRDDTTYILRSELIISIWVLSAGSCELQDTMIYNYRTQWFTTTGHKDLQLQGTKIYNYRTHKFTTTWHKDLLHSELRQTVHFLRETNLQIHVEKYSWECNKWIDTITKDEDLKFKVKKANCCIRSWICGVANYNVLWDEKMFFFYNLHYK